MVFQRFRLLFTSPGGKCGPKRGNTASRAREGNGSECRANTTQKGVEGEREVRKDMMAALQDGCLQFRQRQASGPSRFISVIPILFDGVSLAFPFIL